MPLPVFEAACVLVIALTLWTMARARGTRPVLRDYVALAASAWAGEDTCIELYRFYTYAPDWHLRVHHVPILVPLIWPLVILSARDVVTALWPSLRAGRPIAVAALVAFDASLVEVVAVRAGLWTWAEPGHLGVPVIGVLGWGYFAFGAEVALSRNRPALAVSLGPLAAHALIIATWWAVFRWTVRGDLGPASWLGVVAVSAFAMTVVVRTRRLGLAIPMAIATPRMIAAGLFVALLLFTAPTDLPLWVHALSVAAPYLAATAWLTQPALKETRSLEAPRDPTAPSR